MAVAPSGEYQSSLYLSLPELMLSTIVTFSVITVAVSGLPILPSLSERSARDNASGSVCLDA